MAKYADTLAFEKYHGAGNDFLMVKHHPAGPPYRDVPNMIATACARRTGVGADGLIFWHVEPNQGPRMIYYNADGQKSSFCGNGARCFVRCLHDHGLWPTGEPRPFHANDGLHTGEMLSSGQVRISMLVEGAVSTAEDGSQIIDTGSPHYLEWCSVLPKGDITKRAHQVRYSTAFAKTGINVNYVAEQPSSSQHPHPEAEHKLPHLAIRTYERGVEAETLACGTGVTAAALGYAERKGLTGAISIDVRAMGGNLSVAFTRSADGVVNDVLLTGPAVRVYAGEMKVCA